MWQSQSAKTYIEVVGSLTLLCLILFVIRIFTTDTTRFWFIPENLLLAWTGLLFAWILKNQLVFRRWLSWQNLLLSALWLFFLPNTWYVLTDFMHVYPTGEIGELYDVVLMATMVFTGFSLGFTSLYLVHNELRKRLSEAQSHLLAGLIILLSSFAIYLGRVLRWNSWDVFVDPGGIILNVSDRIIDPFGHPRALDMTALFFVLLSATYFAFYRAVNMLSTSKSRS